MCLSILSIHMATIDFEIYAMGLMHLWDENGDQKLSFFEIACAYARRAPTNVPFILFKVATFVMMTSTFTVVGSLVHFFGIFALPILLGHLLIRKTPRTGRRKILLGHLVNVFANCYISGPFNEMGWNRINTWVSFCLCTVELITCCIFCKYHGHLILEGGSLVIRERGSHRMVHPWFKDNLTVISVVTICIGFAACLLWQVVIKKGHNRSGKDSSREGNTDCPSKKHANEEMVHLNIL